MGNPRIYTMSFASVYPLYVQKAERKNRTQDEVDQIIFLVNWLFERRSVPTISRRSFNGTFLRRGA